MPKLTKWRRPGGEVQRMSLTYFIRMPLGQSEEKTFDVRLQFSVCQIKTFQGLTVDNRSFCKLATAHNVYSAMTKDINAHKILSPSKYTFHSRSYKVKVTHATPSPLPLIIHTSTWIIILGNSRPQNFCQQFSYYLATGPLLDYFKHAKRKTSRSWYFKLQCSFV